MHYQLLLWADSELGLAIFAASLAAIRPLLARLNVSNIAKWTTTRSIKGGPGIGSTDTIGPYKEIRHPNISVSSINCTPRAYVERIVMVDADSYELRHLDIV